MNNTTEQGTLFDMSPIQSQDKQNRIKSLTERNPRPETIETSKLFFRTLEKDKGSSTSISATITMKKDHDKLRVVLKSKNVDENDVKFQLTCELPLDDKHEYDRIYIKTAQDMYDYWLKYEEEKY